MSEKNPPSEQEQLKQAWLGDLSNFIVEANGKTWAADAGEVKPQRPGYKELEYRNGLWLLRDSYTGYFRAPGMTTVYYKNQPSWIMTYGGRGMAEGQESRVKETFNFLKSALMKVSPELPFRGPEIHEDGDLRYTFKILNGDIQDCLWQEEITEKGVSLFSQIGFAGIVIGKDKSRQPVLPWNL